jgi:glutamate-ammonia-ligase adenylyltransferase
MAMSRGRAIAGDGALMQRVSGVLDSLVAKTRERPKLAADVASMRGRIEREKKATSAFDVKLAKGGLMDCEFAAQFLVLAGLGRRAGETTLETLARAGEEGHAPPDVGERLVLSTALQTAILQIARVADPKSFSSDSAPEALKRLLVENADSVLQESGVGAERAGLGSFEDLEARLSDVQAQTRQALEALLGVPVKQAAGP